MISFSVFQIYSIFVVGNFLSGEACIKNTGEYVVRGGSLAGILEDQDKVELLFGYYECNNVKVGDLVAYQFANRSTPLIKKVYGVGGDRFLLKEENNAWHIIVNGDVIKNSQNIPFVLNDSSKNILALYVDGYHGIIPHDAYLILGNVPEGSIDSTYFGLAGKQDIIAKVVVRKR